jgi:hypothetical protein
MPDFDPDRPMPWEPGGYSKTLEACRRQTTGMFAWPPHIKCRQCKESLRQRHGLTPQGQALGWLLRGFGPFCFWCNLDAWQAWKRGLYRGKTALNGW